MIPIQINITAKHGRFNFQSHLETPDAQIIGIYGDSAAGKTFLLRCIAGLENNISGNILINKSIWLDSNLNIFIPPHKRNVGYIFQEPRLLPHLSVKDNLNFAIKPASKSKPAISYDSLLHCLNMTSYLNKYPSQLSGGQQQCVSIARAILSCPDILLMDEPLSGLDRQLKQQIMHLIRKVSKICNLPILYVSHHYSEIMRIATEVTFVTNGNYSPLQAINRITDLAILPTLIEKEIPNVFFGKISQVLPDKTIIATDIGDIEIDNYDDFQKDQSVRLSVYPRDIYLSELQTKSLAENTLETCILNITIYDTRISIVTFAINDALIIGQLPATKVIAMKLKQGMSLQITIKKCIVSAR